MLVDDGLACAPFPLHDGHDVGPFRPWRKREIRDVAGDGVHRGRAFPHVIAPDPRRLARLREAETRLLHRPPVGVVAGEDGLETDLALIQLHAASPVEADLVPVGGDPRTGPADPLHEQRAGVVGMRRL